MVALEWLREQWAWGVLILGVIHCWMVYLAHYRAAERRPEEPAAPDASGSADEIHEFPDGIQETNLPVPSVLRVFYLFMAVWAIAYVLWIRFKIGSF